MHGLIFEEATIRGGATIAYNTAFRGGYYSRGATKQRGRLFEEIRYSISFQVSQDRFVKKVV